MAKLTVLDRRLNELLWLEDGEVDVPAITDAERRACLAELIETREIMKGRHVSVQWLNAEPNPRTAATGYDAGRHAWKFHAVLSDPRQTFTEIKRFHALCGLRPRYGWGLDLFMDITDVVAGKCSKCAKRSLELGLEDRLTEIVITQEESTHA